MIEVIAKLTRGPVYLSGETVELNVMFSHPATSSARSRSSQCRDDLLNESLAWASAQINCRCTIDSRFHGANGNAANGNATTSKGKEDGFPNSSGIVGSATFGDTSLDVSLNDSVNGNVIVTTKPKILFCDLRLGPGQAKTYVYREKIPTDAPPSFRGQLVKYSYKITVGMQRVNSPIQLLHVPLRVLPLCNYIVQGIDVICNDTADDLSPANPFMELGEKRETPFDITLEALQNITSRRNPNFYMFSNVRGKVGRFCLFKSSYKLGEDIVGTFDFTVSTVHCVQLSVSLRCDEETTINDGHANRKRMRSITYSKYHEVCLGLKLTQLILPIPLHVTPEFSTDLVTLRWRLHFEFVTTTSKNLSIASNNGEETVNWQAPAELPIETMVWSLPIKLYSTTPVQVAQGLQTVKVHRMTIR